MSNNTEFIPYLTGIISSFPNKKIDLKNINSSFIKHLRDSGAKYDPETRDAELTDSQQKFEYSMLKNDFDRLIFVKAYYDTSSYLKHSSRTVRINLIIRQEDVKKTVAIWLAKHCHVVIIENGLQIEGSNAIDFLTVIYRNAAYYNSKKFAEYQKIVYGSKFVTKSFKWSRSLPDAIPPGKNRASDSGYDLTLIKLEKTVGNVHFYNTGIHVEPPHGFYFDLYPRSSISKSGYMLANSVGILDASYRGPILVALIKTDPTAKDLELPNRLVQIIPRPIVHFHPVEVDELTETERGCKGFGSSNE